MARRTEQEPGRLDEAAAGLVGRLVDAGLDGVGPLDPAHAVAARALAARGSVEEAVDEVVTTHVRLAAANGFVTGLGGFVTLPVALPVNVAGFYTVATRMVGAIAHLRGYDLSRPEVRSAVLLVLVGADSTSLLTKAGLNPGGRVAGLAMQRLPAPALMVLNKGIGFRLLSQLGTKGLGRLGRAVPLAGGAIGAGLDWWLLRRIAGDARRELIAQHQLEPGR
ncbi:EcsC family protein [Thalassiella azotivora]